jgi:hypothetical protein
MRRTGIALFTSLGLCAACTLTTPLGGYAGSPNDPSDASDAPEASAPVDGGTADADARSDVLSPLVVTSLVLVSAQTGKPVAGYEVITDGMTLPDPRTDWAVRAEVTGTPGSVQFALDGVARTEGQAPYYLCGDSEGIIERCDLGSGTHAITVTPWTAPEATGTAGKSLTLEIRVP